MSTYTLWDVHSTTLLLETRALDRIAEATTAFVADNGEAALDDLLLGIETEDNEMTQQHSGIQILRALAREQGAVQTA